MKLFVELIIVSRERAAPLKSPRQRIAEYVMRKPHSTTRPCSLSRDFPSGSNLKHITCIIQNRSRRKYTIANYAAL